MQLDPLVAVVGAGEGPAADLVLAPLVARLDHRAVVREQEAARLAEVDLQLVVEAAQRAWRAKWGRELANEPSGRSGGDN